MGFTFRKRIRVMKGVHLNVSPKGASVSVGGKGVSVTKGRGRTSLSVGVPGSGVAYRTTRKDEAAAPELDASGDSAAAYGLGREIARLGLLRWLAGWLSRGVACIIAMMAAIGLLSAIGDDGERRWTSVLVAALLIGMAMLLWRSGARLLKR